ncbi:uncharacterized protein V1518DRAFT_418556 [Limtongia smithiae]|uniref:uncharacterized protein n=1 Tax=Limtongia smithiae TaxID=1125753 RepID=UPI0034CFFD2A
MTLRQLVKRSSADQILELDIRAADDRDDHDTISLIPPPPLAFLSSKHSANLQTSAHLTSLESQPMSAAYRKYADLIPSISEPEWNQLNSLVDQDPDSFDNWEKLIQATEALEGGLGRSSSPEVIEQARRVFDAFLGKFPLLFGYWKRYADAEFAISGSDASELIYQRAVASIPGSVDLWTSYCSLKMETCPDDEEVRDLFDTAADFVGLDFLSHTFWDKYIEFEERMERQDLLIKLLERIIHIPMHQYARYFESYTTLGATRPIDELASEQDISDIKKSITNADRMGKPKSHAEVEREVRTQIHKLHTKIFSKTQEETMSRWPFEAEIKRPYFHVTLIDESELVNWRKYLDFEELEGDVERIRFLYEKCLVATALYDEFWFRYARWTLSQGEDLYEDVRNIYRRGSALFVPICRPAFRVAYAHFEEGTGEISLARDIFESELVELPGNLEILVARANLERRVAGVDAAIQFYKNELQSNTNDVYTKGSLVAEWSKLIWTSKGSDQEARDVFVQYKDKCLDSRYFWINYLQFELGLPTSSEIEHERYKRISEVHYEMRTTARLPPTTVKDLSHTYMVYLLERGGASAIQEYNRLDAEVNG